MEAKKKHAIVLTKKGVVHGWGANDFG